MNWKCGIVGLPHVGKSILFNALTKAGIAQETVPQAGRSEKANGLKHFRECINWMRPS